jgi:8-oxo-dGTP diphosphatase
MARAEADPMRSALIADASWRFVYRAGYRSARVWWRLRRPHHHGAVIAVWLDGQILGVRQSYSDVIAWPGGGIRAGEDEAHAAARELREELGLDVDPGALVLVRRMTVQWDFRHDHVRVFELHLTAPPIFALDNREITEARFMPPGEMLAARTPPFVSIYLRERLIGGAGQLP